MTGQGGSERSWRNSRMGRRTCSLFGQGVEFDSTRTWSRGGRKKSYLMQDSAPAIQFGRHGIDAYGYGRPLRCFHAGGEAALRRAPEMRQILAAEHLRSQDTPLWTGWLFRGRCLRVLSFQNLSLIGRLKQEDGSRP